MKIVVVVGLVVLALSTTASAQPRNEELSEDVALGLSLGGTLASWAMVFGGVAASDNSDTGETIATIGAIGTMFAPSAGHVYAGDLITRGFGIRAAGVLSAGTGVGVLLSSCFENDSCDQGAALGTILMIAGVSLYAAGTIDDIVTAPRKVRRHNQSLTSVALAPRITTTSAGVSLGGRF